MSQNCDEGVVNSEKEITIEVVDDLLFDYPRFQKGWKNKFFPQYSPNTMITSCETIYPLWWGLVFNIFNNEWSHFWDIMSIPGLDINATDKNGLTIAEYTLWNTGCEPFWIWAILDCHCRLNHPLRGLCECSLITIADSDLSCAKCRRAYKTTVKYIDYAKRVKDDNWIVN